MTITEREAVAPAPGVTAPATVIYFGLTCDGSDNRKMPTRRLLHVPYLTGCLTFAGTEFAPMSARCASVQPLPAIRTNADGHPIPTVARLTFDSAWLEVT